MRATFGWLFAARGNRPLVTNRGIRCQVMDIGIRPLVTEPPVSPCRRRRKRDRNTYYSLALFALAMRSGLFSEDETAGTLQVLAAVPCWTRAS